MTTAVGAQVKRFKQLLRIRGMTVNRLAAVALVGRCHLSQVLHRKRTKGNFTRKRVAAHLAADELEVLGWDAFGNLIDGPNVLTGDAISETEAVPVGAPAAVTEGSEPKVRRRNPTVPAEQSRTQGVNRRLGKRSEILKGSPTSVGAQGDRNRPVTEGQTYPPSLPPVKGNRDTGAIAGGSTEGASNAGSSPARPASAIKKFPRRTMFENKQTKT